MYLDYHATTPVDRRVLDRMLPYFTETFGNPASSTHQWGWKAQEAVENARREVSALIGASAREVYFTSGATEADNLAIKGVAESSSDRGDHIVTVATEHRAVLDTCRHRRLFSRHRWSRRRRRCGGVRPCRRLRDRWSAR